MNIGEELRGINFIGVVEENLDPKRKGRVKIRVERLHGRTSDRTFVATEDLPWAMPTIGNGYDHSIPSVGKTMYVKFEDGDYYKPVYHDSEHYNFNLQDKLQTLDDDKYSAFYAISYDDKHQYFHDRDEGVVFDYVKSNINFRTNGDIRVNLRDNDANLYLGTEDASEPAVLGNHWMNWMDKLVDNLLGAKGGPYIGNFGAPVLPNPGMIQVLNEYKAIRETFLSDHVFIVDDNRVKAQTREFDLELYSDNFNTEDLQPVNPPQRKPLELNERPPSGDTPSNVPTNTFSSNLDSSTLPNNPTDSELLKNQKPFNQDYDNGRIPTEKLTQNTYLSQSFSDERSFLISDASDSLTQLIDLYNQEKDSSWNNITATKGYQNYERQVNIKNQYPTRAPLPGKDPFGWANQFELYWNVDKRNSTETRALKNYIRSGNLSDNPSKNELTLDYLVRKGKNYNLRLAGRTSTGELQWWHWIYDPNVANIDIVNNLSKFGLGSG